MLMSLYVSCCCRYHSSPETLISTSWLRSLRLLGRPQKRHGLLVFFSQFCLWLYLLCPDGENPCVHLFWQMSLQGVSSLPDYVSFKIFPGTPLEHIFSAAGDDLLELLQCLYTFNPSTRSTATQVICTLKPSGWSENYSWFSFAKLVFPVAFCIFGNIRLYIISIC